MQGQCKPWALVSFSRVTAEWNVIAHHFRHYAPEDVPYGKKRVYLFNLFGFHDYNVVRQAMAMRSFVFMVCSISVFAAAITSWARGLGSSVLPM
jgi:hypothetical protein